jgi:hypothetical protein
MSEKEIIKNLTWTDGAAFVLLGGLTFAEGPAPHRGRVVADPVPTLKSCAAVGAAA